MNEEYLRKIAEKLFYNDKTIKYEEVEYIRGNRDFGIPYFEGLLDSLIEEPLDNEEYIYNMSFFGIMYLAEWGDTAAFKRIQRILHLMGKEVDRWLGDGLTENLPDIMYRLYDGDLENLMVAVRDREMEEFSSILFWVILPQLYLDGKLEKEKLLSYARSFDEEDLDGNYYLATEVCYSMAKAGVLEFLPDIRHYCEEERIDYMVAGNYQDYVNIMYEDRREVIKPMTLEDQISKWYKIEGYKKEQRYELPRNINSSSRYYEMAMFRYRDVNRNDPCPCGSGQKFKRCCLGKLEEAKRNLNERQNNRAWKILEYYPELSFDPFTGKDYPEFKKEENRNYLEDSFDRESIMIDVYAYIGAKRRNNSFYNPFGGDDELISIRKTYLEKAKELLKEKMKKEGLSSYEEYDEKYEIHFKVKEWIV